MHNEFKNCITLHEFIEAHINYCIENNFDQILDSDKISKECCNCGNIFKIEFSKIALELFCDECKNIDIESKHIEKHNKQMKLFYEKLHS